ncbi:hypothetical protein KXV52_008691 [Aspergillus fumigatus]|nr:hypothetical protein KXX21_007039 [Aspergillus fumigatus]KAH3333887.1 hypothetical protein KXW81_006034 [Aspergillus fumigatus]KAH3351014.1 hypothetical protein KXV52_008691 [Aspergillus fumigatus]KMK60549.1 hypothetical protein Y699_01750 [Aspergillus fumigatus Z5]
MSHYREMTRDILRCQKANPTRAKARAKADESIAKATLLKARKPDHYRYDSETFEPLIEQIAGCFALAIPNEAPQAAPITGRAIKLNERCGAPQERIQLLD